MRGHDQAGRGGAERSGGGIAAASPPEVARFLGAHPPFDALQPRELARVAAGAELASFAAGDTIFAQGVGPVHHVWVVRDGAVEIVAEDRVLDLLGEGEMFGHASMLSGLPTGFTARAARPTTCLRIGMELARQVLGAPEGLRYVARSLLEEPTDLHVLAREAGSNVADEPVAALLRAPAVVCTPSTTIREAARRMSEAGVNAVVVSDPAHPADGLGILTDRDLRLRVVAAGVSGDAPVSAAMSAPAYTCDADRPAGDVLLEMLDRGLRHMPVLSAAGGLAGVIEDMDLVAARTRSWLYLRRRIAAAGSAGELAGVAREIGPMVVALHEARVASANVMAVYALCVDALTRRMLELADGRSVGVQFAWLAMGSQARREALPSSDVDSAIVYFGEDDPATRERLVAVGQTVLDGLQACGMRLDEHGVNASAPAFVRSVASWQREARRWLENPTAEKALVLSSVVVDSRQVWGPPTAHTGTPVADTFALAPDHPALLRLLARFALTQRPPTGFLRGLVVEHSGEHRGRLDLKRGGTIPIVALARWAAMAAGVTSASTGERLRVAAEAGTLPESDAHTLADAFTLINNLRLEHQVRQVRAGDAPDDHVAPDELSPLRRTQLKDAFRAVAAVQKRVDGQLRLGAQ